MPLTPEAFFLLSKLLSSREQVSSWINPGLQLSEELPAGEKSVLEWHWGCSNLGWGRNKETQPWAVNCSDLGTGEFLLLCLRRRSAMLPAEFLRLSFSSVMGISTKKAACERLLRKGLVTCYWFKLCNLAAEGHLFLAALLTGLNKDCGFCRTLEQPFWTTRNSLQLQWFARSCQGRDDNGWAAFLPAACRSWCFPLPWAPQWCETKTMSVYQAFLIGKHGSSVSFLPQQTWWRGSPSEAFMPRKNQDVQFTHCFFTSLHNYPGSFPPHRLHAHLSDQAICWDLTQCCLNRVCVNIILNDVLGAHAAHASLACD